MQTISVFVATALAVVACTSGDKKDGEAPPAAEAAGKPAAEPESKPAAAPEAKPAAAPAGKPMRVTEVGMETKPFVVTIPDGFTAELQDGNPEELPYFEINGPDLQLYISGPNGDSVVDLEGAKRNHLSMDPKATFERADKEPDGFTLIVRHGASGAHAANTYSVEVARPSFEVECASQNSLPTRAVADAAAAICATIRK